MKFTFQTRKNVLHRDLLRDGFSFGKRYYDPLYGRMLTEDPAGYIDGMNLYHFVFNNPIRYTDLNGCFAIVVQVATYTFGGAVSAPAWPVIAAGSVRGRSAKPHLLDIHLGMSVKFLGVRVKVWLNCQES